MVIPESFKAAHARVFNDKTIEHYKPAKVKGSLGSITQKPENNPSGFYLMNFQPVSSEKRAQEWGLQLSEDATASTCGNLPIKTDDYLKYNGTFYRVIKVLTHDSHTRYLCKVVH